MPANPEQVARDRIGALPRASGWAVQGKGEPDAVRRDAADKTPTILDCIMRIMVGAVGR